MVFLQLNYTMKAATGQPFLGRPVGFFSSKRAALVRQPQLFISGSFFIVEKHCNACAADQDISDDAQQIGNISED